MPRKKRTKQTLLRDIGIIERAEIEYGFKEFIQGLLIGFVIGFVIATLLI